MSGKGGAVKKEEGVFKGLYDFDSPGREKKEEQPPLPPKQETQATPQPPEEPAPSPSSTITAVKEEQAGEQLAQNFLTIFESELKNTPGGGKEVKKEQQEGKQDGSQYFGTKDLNSPVDTSVSNFFDTHSLTKSLPLLHFCGITTLPSLLLYALSKYSVEASSLPPSTKDDPYIQQLFKGVTKLASVRMWQKLNALLKEEQQKQQQDPPNAFVSLIPTVPHLSEIPQDSEKDFTEWLTKAGVTQEGVQTLTRFYDVRTAGSLQRVVEERGGMVALRKLERLFEIDFLILQLGVQRVKVYPILDGEEGEGEAEEKREGGRVKASLPDLDEEAVMQKGVGECQTFRELGMNEDLLLDLREKNILLPVLFILLNLNSRTSLFLQTALSFSPLREKERERRKCGTIRGRIAEGFGEKEVERWMREVGAGEVVDRLWPNRETLCINNGQVLKEMAQGRDCLEDWATLFSEIPFNQVFLLRSALMEDFCSVE